MTDHDMIRYLFALVSVVGALALIEDYELSCKGRDVTWHNYATNLVLVLGGMLGFFL